CIFFFSNRRWNTRFSRDCISDVCSSNLITTWCIWYSTPFSMLFAILVNSLLMSFVFLLYHIVAKRLPAKIHLIFLAAIWMAFEKFHLNWDFSWPWLNLGNVFSENISWIQWYEYTEIGRAHV